MILSTIDFPDDGPSLLPDITDPGMFPFLVIINQMGHDVCVNL
jgi:hypothetical protein